MLLPHRVLLYTFNQYFFQTKSPKNIDVLLVLGSFLEVGVRKVGWEGECPWCLRALWGVAAAHKKQLAMSLQGASPCCLGLLPLLLS